MSIKIWYNNRWFKKKKIDQLNTNHYYCVWAAIISHIARYLFVYNFIITTHSNKHRERARRRLAACTQLRPRSSFVVAVVCRSVKMGKEKKWKKKSLKCICSRRRSAWETRARQIHYIELFFHERHVGGLTGAAIFPERPFASRRRETT